MKQIIEKDFKLTSVSDGSIFFDLEILLPVFNKEKNETRYEFKNVAYGLPLSTALIRVAMHRSEDSEKTDLLSYIERFEEACRELEKIKI